MRNKYLSMIVFIAIIFSSCTEKKVENIYPKKVSKVKVVVKKEPSKKEKRKSVKPLNLNDVPIEIKESESSKKIKVSLENADIKDVLVAIVKGTDYSLYIEPGVTGKVEVADLKNVTLKEALDYFLKPLGLSYKIEKNKTIHVFKKKYITKVFTFDFIAVKRKGQRTVAFSSRSQVTSGGGSSIGGGTSSIGSSSGGSGGGMGGGGQNESSANIEVKSENTLWKEFIDGLYAILFEGEKNVGVEKGSSTQGDESVEGISYSTEDGKRLIVSPQTGIILITHYPEKIELAEKFITAMQRASHREVWIEAKFIEVILNKAHQMGIDWNSVYTLAGFRGILPDTETLVAPSASYDSGSPSIEAVNPSYGIFRFQISNRKIEMLLDALSTQGEIKILSSPRISTLNNQKAIIRVVREEAFFSMQTQITTGVTGSITAPSINVQVVPIGIVMDIIPQISSDGSIILSINPDISQLVGIKTFEAQGASAMQPIIDRRSIDTIVKVKDGQTVVLGGIMEERKQEILRGIPVLMNLPFVGSLFRRTEQEIRKTELVILLTPHIMKGKKIEELTESERKRVEKAIRPFHLTGIVPLDEGLRGELKQKEKK